jgi:hypothetical protein
VPYLQFLLDRISKTEDRTNRGEVQPEQAMATLEKDVKREMAKRKELGFAR